MASQGFTAGKLEAQQSLQIFIIISIVVLAIITPTPLKWASLYTLGQAIPLGIKGCGLAKTKIFCENYTSETTSKGVAVGVEAMTKGRDGFVVKKVMIV